METMDAFAVFLPHAGEAIARQGNPSDCKSPSIVKKRFVCFPCRLNVMIVEKHPIILKAVAAMMITLGYSISTAQEGVDALFRLQSAVYDLLLIDFDMPSVSGYLLGRLAKMKHPNTKVIVMTNFCHAEVVAFISRGGVDGWLFKPFSFVDLQSALTAIGPSRRNDMAFCRADLT